MKHYFLIFWFAALVLSSCQKDQGPSDVPQASTPMSGKIIWPSGANVDTAGVKVSTFHSAVSPVQSGFTVDTINRFSTVFVTDTKGDVKLMRYNYPGQPDNNISIQSTALALIMNAPIVVSITDEGRKTMIEKMLLDPKFSNVVDEVRKAVNSNKDILDTNNTTLIQASSQLFESASTYKTALYRGVPLNIKTANPATFSFENNNVSHKYVVGIYKNNNRIQKLVVNGTQSFAASFKDVLDGVFGNGYSSPDVQIYSTQADGILEIKIRSGAPGIDDNSLEYKEAFKENVIQYVFTLVRSHMPFDNKCTKNAFDGIKAVIESSQALTKATTPADFANIALGFSSDLLNTRASMFQDCSKYKDPYYKNPFWSAAGKFFKFFDKVGKIGQGLNIGMHVYDLYNSRAAIDTCFNVVDKKVSKCGQVTVAGGNGEGPLPNQLSSPTSVFVDSDGNVYVSDGGNDRVQKWAPGATSGITVAGGNGRGVSANQLGYPQGLFVDASGSVYVYDRVNERVQLWNKGAALGITVAGGNGRGSSAKQFNVGCGIFVDNSGNIYVADWMNDRVQKWAPGASSGITVAGGKGYGGNANQLQSPSDVFVDNSGNLYVLDCFNHRVQKWAPGATSGITVAGGNGSGSAANQFDRPQGIFVDPLGIIFVADGTNNRIQKWSPGATSGVTVAKGGILGMPSEWFDDVFIDKLGKIYVLESRTNRIQKWEP